MAKYTKVELKYLGSCVQLQLEQQDDGNYLITLPEETLVDLVATVNQKGLGLVTASLVTVDG